MGPKEAPGPSQTVSPETGEPARSRNERQTMPYQQISLTSSCPGLASPCAGPVVGKAPAAISHTGVVR